MIRTLSIIIPVYKILNTTTWNNFVLLINSIAESIEQNFNRIKIDSFVIINDFPEEDVEEKLIDLFTSIGYHDRLVIKTNDKNRGQAYSRNLGAQLVDSEYLHFIDQDDFISSNFYEIMKEEKDLLMANIFLYSDESKRSKLYFKERLIARLTKARFIHQLRFLLLSNLTYSPGQYIIKKEIFNRAGGYPDLKNKGADDFGIFVKLADLPVVSIKFYPNSFFFYRLHLNQSKNRLDMLASLNEFYSSYTFQNKVTKALTTLKRTNYLKYFIIIFNRLLFFKSTKIN